MNEGKKTLAFWAAAAVILGIAGWITWPEPTIDTNNLAGNDLFEKFTDPQLASSMKIVTFDEEQGQLDTFEVRRDRESGLWNIPSRDGYPADAIEQMRTAANSLIGLKILDIQTENAEDHDDLGVAEPKLEDLEVGDEGVGRLVTFKSESQDTLASIIIGDQEKSDPEKRYVRIPGQDPVYVVKLDQSSLSTNFEDWIESDLLKLSSIDISELQIQDYAASVGLGGQLSLTRNYSADIQLDGTDWKLLTLSEYEPGNPLAEPTPVEVAEDQKLSKTKLDEMKNALDDLKIVNVVRKPDEMSASLRANKDILDNREALASLQKNGFFPARAGPEGEVEILSANGELSVTLKDGVKYVMRFGNIAGVSEDEGTEDEGKEDEEAEGEEETSSGGVNRYLLVTTMVDESRFPPPELQTVPKTIDELQVLLNPPKQKSEPEESAGDEDKDDETADVSDSAESNDESEEEPADEPETQPEDGEGSDEDTEESATEGETDSEGSGEATGSGEAQEDDDKSEASDAASDPESSVDEADEDQPSSDADDSQNEAAEDKPAAGDESEDDADKELTEEELQERLEAEQEKITKANQRKLDARKDQIEAAEKKVRELNGRFADWYYVIAEDTYAKLRIKRDDLFEKADAAAGAPVGAAPDAGPQFKIPGGLPGN